MKTPLIQVHTPTEASWVEYFYDGTAKVEKGIVREYKDHWLFELYNRGFRPIPDEVPEAPVHQELLGTEIVAEPGQADATRRSRRKNG